MLLVELVQTMLNQKVHAWALLQYIADNVTRHKLYMLDS